MGAETKIDTVEYGKAVDLNGVKVSLHQAGHVLGSSQVRVEYQGEVWVFTGDYKRQADKTCRAFELVKCHTLISECTFGLPIFRWKDPTEVHDAINQWWQGNVAEGKTSLIIAYCLGKAQRVLSHLDASIGPILLHGSMLGMVEAYRQSGVELPATEHATAENAKKYRGKAMVIAPDSALGGTWIRKFLPVSDGIASGWMQVRGIRRRRSADRGFVLSDHVDWPALLQTIQETEASRIILTHGYTQPVAKFLRERGMVAEAFETRFKNEGEEEETENNAVPDIAAK
jgi:putative mRNA 3-end processing factor